MSLLRGFSDELFILSYNNNPSIESLEIDNIEKITAVRDAAVSRPWSVITPLHVKAD